MRDPKKGHENKWLNLNKWFQFPTIQFPRITMSNFQCAETLPEWACLSGKDITVIPPNLKTLESKFVVQITGEGLWQWKKILSKLCAFEALNSTLRTLGYSITPAAKPRIAQCLYQAIQSFTKKVSSRLLGKAARDRLKSNKVYELCVEETEMLLCRRMWLTIWHKKKSRNGEGNKWVE